MKAFWERLYNSKKELTAATATIWMNFRYIMLREKEAEHIMCYFSKASKQAKVNNILFKDTCICGKTVFLK